MANLKAMLKEKATEKTPGAKKSTMPVLPVTGDLSVKVSEYQAAKVQYKQAEAVMKATEPEIIDFVRARQDADGFAGRYQGSYQVVGEKDSVKVIFMDKYSVSGTDEAQIKEILGNQFDEMVEEKFTVTVKPEVLEDENLSAQLQALIGDRWNEFFNITTNLTIKPDFKKNIYRSVDPSGLNNLRTFVRQYKPSMK